MPGTLHSPPSFLTFPEAEARGKMRTLKTGNQLEAGVTSHQNNPAKDGWVKSKNGVRETEEGTGGNLENTVVAGEMFQMINAAEQEVGKVTWKRGDLSEGDGEETLEANLSKTGGVQVSIQQQHRYQTAKWHQ